MRESAVQFAVVGIDHRHVYDLIGGMLAAGSHCVGYCKQGSDERVAHGLASRFPQLRAFAQAQDLLSDPEVDVIVSAAIPADRAGIADAAMRNGKDVLVDKPGVTTAAQLQMVRQAVSDTGQIFSICFSERFLVPAVQYALELVQDGAIGEPLHTLGLGPHRLNAAIRPDWFFKEDRCGGILVDIASHQIDQFLMFTDSLTAQIVHSHVGQYDKKRLNTNFDDFGEIVLQTERHRGYVRVDWYTPDGLPVWGDGRFFVTGTEGTLEIRKYVDVEGKPGGNHLFLANRHGTHYINCDAMPLNFFTRFVADVQARTQTAMSQSHTLEVCALALQAQAMARRGSDFK
jgi:predicted dehydrogenase